MGGNVTLCLLQKNLQFKVVVGNGGLNSKTILCTIWLVLPWMGTYGSCFATNFPLLYLHHLVICIILNTIWLQFHAKVWILRGCGNINQDPGTYLLLWQNLRYVCTLLVASKSTYTIWYLQLHYCALGGNDLFQIIAAVSTRVGLKESYVSQFS